MHLKLKSAMVLKFFLPDPSSEQPLPLFLNPVKAGFPSPADNPFEEKLDLNKFLIQNPPATFFVKVEGESMVEAGIRDGDLLSVDRSIEPQDGKIVIAALGGEFTVKRIKLEGRSIYLMPENPRFPKIKVSPEEDFQIWGVVTYIIHDTAHRL